MLFYHYWFGIKERRISKIHSQQEEIKYLEDLIKNSQDNEKKKTAQVRLSNIKQTFKDNITKIRPIRYASHLDGHIYGFYASQILLPKYEKIVQENDLDKEILAYRTIPEEFKGDSTFHRSSNITMAKEVFEQIIKRKNNCIALAYDLKSFYDTIDHKKLKEAWCRVLGEDKLPDDHYNIYKSLTRYCYVDLKKFVSILIIKNTAVHPMENIVVVALHVKHLKQINSLLFFLKNQKIFASLENGVLKMTFTKTKD